MAVKVRQTRTSRGDWTVNGKISSRQVQTQTPDGETVTFSQVSLADVTDPAEALTLLKLKGKRAVNAIVRGYNTVVRKSAVDELSLVARLSELYGITAEEARKRIRG